MVSEVKITNSVLPTAPVSERLTAHLKISFWRNPFPECAHVLHAGEQVAHYKMQLLGFKNWFGFSL